MTVDNKTVWKRLVRRALHDEKNNDEDYRGALCEILLLPNPNKFQ